uniref:NIF system FeS cluster assembly NifU C-terminal domain-containing protein n=1 Tax=Leersia perrieri TaxID=77586 RepID=A0A0D9VTB8_9ORYZ
MAGSDATFKSVKVKLCYVPASRIDRGWRKANDDLHKDKACRFKVTGGNSAFDYAVARDISTASYFTHLAAASASTPPAAGGGLYSVETYELTAENVDRVLDNVCPYLITNGDDVIVASVKDNVISLKLEGEQLDCP